MATSIDESLLTEIAARRAKVRSLVGVSIADLRLILSESDLDSYLKLEDICYAREGRWGGQAYKFEVIKAFDSPLYSDASKKYFAAAHMGNEVLLSICDPFLTEKIILSYVTNAQFESFSASEFATLIRSKHMSEQIILAIIEGMGNFSDFRAYKVLEVVPDLMITPEVVVNWLVKVSGGRKGGFLLTEAKVAAVLRIKQAHPEYEGFPDEWVLKVFCGR